MLFNIAEDPAELTNLAWKEPERTKELTKKLDAWSDSLLPSARYDPEGRGKTMAPSFAGAPAGIKPDARYQIPYDKPVATPYPAVVQSPGAPEPENWQVEKPAPAKPAGKPPASPEPAPGQKEEPKQEPKQAQEQLFKKRDKNQDGEVTLEEFIGDPKGRNVPVLTKRFKQLDGDGDGKLTLEEIKKPKGEK